MTNIGIADEAIQAVLDKNRRPETDADGGPTCLYRHFDSDCNLLYVGISICFWDRLRAHSARSSWHSQIAFVTVDHYETRHKAEIAEDVAIALEKPKYNIRNNLSSLDHNLFDPTEAKARAELQSAKIVKIFRDMSLERTKKLKDTAKELRGEVASE